MPYQFTYSNHMCATSIRTLPRFHLNLLKASQRRSNVYQQKKLLDDAIPYHCLPLALLELYRCYRFVVHTFLSLVSSPRLYSLCKGFHGVPRLLRSTSCSAMGIIGIDNCISIVFLFPYPTFWSRDVEGCGIGP